MSQIIIGVLLLIASLGWGIETSPDLIVVSSSAAAHTAVLVQPGAQAPIPVAELSDVSAAILKLFNVNGINGSIFGPRLPRALLMMIVGGLAPQMVNESDLPNLSAILEGSPKSFIDTIPEPRTFDNMVKIALSTKDTTLAQQLQNAFQNEARFSTSSASGLVCDLVLGCDTKSSNMDALLSAIGGMFQNQVLMFPGNNGKTFQLDTSDKIVSVFLNEIAMALSSNFQSSESSAPSIISVAISTLQPVLNEYGIHSDVAEACFHVLDASIPKIMESFRQAFLERAEIAMLLLPPSYDAYMTEEVRQILLSVDGETSRSSAFVYLSDPSSAAVIQKGLAARLPLNFQILSVERGSSSQSGPNPALYQITLWVSVMLVVLVIVSAGALLCGETRKDTLLYSKITPSNDKKNR